MCCATHGYAEIGILFGYTALENGAVSECFSRALFPVEVQNFSVRRNVTKREYV